MAVSVCPYCLRQVTVRGAKFVRHDTGFAVRRQCAGSGRPAKPEPTRKATS